MPASSNDPGLLLGKGDKQVFLLPKLANRHGLIAGATGTGKTVSLRVIAEGLSKRGVPVFLADVKGDVSGTAAPGQSNPKIEERAQRVGVPDFAYRASPVVFWDVFGEKGHPIRATISEMGPLLLSRLLDLNDIQEAVLYVAFKVADENGLLLLDLKDLRAMLAWLGEHKLEIGRQYGAVSEASIASIQRALLVLEQDGGAKFFGEPALDLADLMLVDKQGRGAINILAADKLISKPKAYSTLLLWMLSELFENLPEVGDPEKPMLVFFFDEAHLLFNDAPKALLEKIEQVVRLIRSKGVGVYFCTQNPLDVPDTVLGQLGNRIQHALRAFTPRDQKAVKAAAETFRVNPKFKTYDAIMQLGVGEALVSTLDEKGIPSPVERAFIRPPESRFGEITADERAKVMSMSPVGERYDQTIDRESAHEVLSGKLTGQTEQAPAPSAQTVDDGNPWGTQARTAPGRSPIPQSQPQQPQQPYPQQPTYQPEQPQYPPQQQAPQRSPGGILGDLMRNFPGRQQPQDQAPNQQQNRPRGYQREGLGEAVAKSVLRSVGSSVGRQIARGILGSIFKG
ncbi:MAG: helicase HerA-like domain-containing protein [Alphaproteobacteria bacterium]